MTVRGRMTGINQNDGKGRMTGIGWNDMVGDKNIKRVLTRKAGIC
jgi:hypothetical protein